MHLIIAGSGDAFGSGGRFQTCIAVAEDEGAPPNLLIDCGTTSLTALRREGLDPNLIDTVVLSHLHGDHFGGLPFLVLDGQFRRRTRDLTVLGPPGTAERLHLAMETLFPGSTTVTRRFQVHVRTHETSRPTDAGAARVSAHEVRHASGAPAYGVRVGLGGRTVAYSGDTEWTDALLELSSGADLFLAEGYSPRPVRWHLDLESLTANRERFDCGAIVLTHLSPSALELDLRDWEVAHDGLRHTV